MSGGFGHSSLSQSIDGSTGSYSTRGYGTDWRLGHVFPLLGTPVPSAARVRGKRQAVAAATSFVGLVVSAHLGYRNDQAGGFTDSVGFIYGNDTFKYGEVGGRARLFAVLPRGALTWMPYVAGTLDQRFGLSHDSFVPGFAGGDVITFQNAKTFWGSDFGISARVGTGAIYGAEGFYRASSDTSIAGGRGYIKVPFGPPAGVLRY